MSARPSSAPPPPAPPSLAGSAARAVRVTAATSWRRTLAHAIDFLPRFTVWLLAAFAIGAAAPATAPAAPWNPLDRVVDFMHAHPVATSLIALLWLALAFAWPYASHVLWSRTPGERALGLTAVDDRALPLDRRRLALWCALRVLGTLLAFIGPLWALADPDRRTLHDRLAGVWVLRTPA